MPCTRPQESLTRFNLLQRLTGYLASRRALPHRARRHGLGDRFGLRGTGRGLHPLKAGSIHDGLEVFACRRRRLGCRGLPRRSRLGSGGTGGRGLWPRVSSLYADRWR